MSIVPVSSEIIIPERMNSVNTAFIDGTLPVDPSLDEGTKKDHETLTDKNTECKSKDALNSYDQLPDQEIATSENDTLVKNNETPLDNQMNSCNESSISQESNSKAYSETLQATNITSKLNTEEEKSFLNTCIDNRECSIDITQNEGVTSVVKESINSQDLQSANLPPDVCEEQDENINEDKNDSTNILNDTSIDIEISSQLHCDEDEYFPCPFRPMSPQSQLRDLCKRGDAEQLEKFLADMCESEDNENHNVKVSDTQNRQQFSKCIDKSKIDLDAATEDGWTALHDIITHECQFTDVARVLLRYGANVNTQDIHGDSPLHSSLLYHNTDNIELLLKYSANVEATNASGRKPIHIANDAESLDLLLKYGASVNSQDRIGNTPLHYAVVAKDCDRVNLLLEKGCDVDIANNTGACPLHISNDIEIANKLLNAAANPNTMDQNGNIALHVAVKGRHKEWAKLLIYWKGDPHVSNKNGKTPFNLAKDKEMKNILLGKTSEQIGAVYSGDTITTLKKLTKSRNNASNSTGNITDSHLPLPYPPTPIISSPSILKRRLDSSGHESGIKPRGPRLRFSDVNDYSGVEELLPPKRVKVRPIYSEPQFSSDED